MKILIAHELGTGRDGLIRLSAMAQYLKEAFIGCSVVLAMKRPPDSKLMCSKYIDKIINNPSNNCVDGFVSPLHFLNSTYFNGGNELNILRKKWTDIIRVEKPSLIISDNSPSALLISHELSIPCVNVSTGIYSSLPTAISEESNNCSSGSESCQAALKKMHASGAVEDIIIGIKNPSVQFRPSTIHSFLETDKDDDGGLNLDVFAYIKKHDSLKDEIIMALDQLNANYGKRIMIVMQGVEPLLYKPDFEVTPHFARLPGALFNSPLVINSFGAGLCVDAIRHGCPIWGIPSSTDQRYNRTALGKIFSGASTPKSKADIVPSLLLALESAQEHKDEAKKLWNNSIKNGMLPLATCLTEKVQRLSL